MLSVAYLYSDKNCTYSKHGTFVTRFKKDFLDFRSMANEKLSATRATGGTLEQGALFTWVTCKCKIQARNLKQMWAANIGVQGRG